jgi:hypothetical protein
MTWNRQELAGITGFRTALGIGQQTLQALFEITYRSREFSDFLAVPTRGHGRLFARDF